MGKSPPNILKLLEFRTYKQLVDCRTPPSLKGGGLGFGTTFNIRQSTTFKPKAIDGPKLNAQCEMEYNVQRTEEQSAKYSLSELVYIDLVVLCF
jgi:hypothetical protein